MWVDSQQPFFRQNLKLMTYSIKKCYNKKIDNTSEYVMSSSFVVNGCCESLMLSKNHLNFNCFMNKIYMRIKFEIPGKFKFKLIFILKISSFKAFLSINIFSHLNFQHKSPLSLDIVEVNHHFESNPSSQWLLDTALHDWWPLDGVKLRARTT